LHAAGLFLLSTQVSFAQDLIRNRLLRPLDESRKVHWREVPQFTDITAKAGIHFSHVSSSDSKYVVESMSGGVPLIAMTATAIPISIFTKRSNRGHGHQGQAPAGGSITTITTEHSRTSPTKPGSARRASPWAAPSRLQE